MAVPKRRTSHSKQGMRRSHHHKTPIQVQYCTRCNEPVLLTLAAFDAVPMHEALVAPGHARVQPDAA